MGLPMVGNGLCLTLNTPCSCNNYLSLLFHPFVQKCVKEQLLLFMKVIAIAPNNWALVSFQMTFINLCITLVKQCQCQHVLGYLTLLQSMISQSCQRLNLTSKLQQSFVLVFPTHSSKSVSKKMKITVIAPITEHTCSVAVPGTWSPKKALFKSFASVTEQLFTWEVSLKRMYGVIIL